MKGGRDHSPWMPRCSVSQGDNGERQQKRGRVGRVGEPVPDSQEGKEGFTQGMEVTGACHTALGVS